MPHWIQHPDTLATWWDRKPTRIGMDTEFIRERTFWPELALVQIAIEDEILLVDPLVPGMTDALGLWLAAPNVIKIMHSASEDLIAFKYACGVLPRPLFDTQIGAALTGLGGGMGYQKLVATVTNVALEKGETRSDWMHRPLTPAQLDYAANDVRYLFALHDTLTERLAEMSRSAWLEEDCTRLTDNIEQNENERWPHLAIHSAQLLDAPAQYRLLRLLRWRETSARTRNKPRNWILNNELASILARFPPPNLTELRYQLKKFNKSWDPLATQILEALHTPVADEAQAPLATAPSDADKALLKQLQKIVAECSYDLGLPEGILASRRHLEALIEQRRWPNSLGQWRRSLLETQLQPLLSMSDT
ncbi:ribonuclease D [Xylella fastidiosa]|uniref:Ribonuclease D n=1 Tax=Xylella fastidiosa (strain 9a5c) TaxID=160492 RepID=Q9PFC7_XYLFA|nr:ribonuclease D [Xylella fastidiosa]AAF83561.1 ribonuclease D [Xylella fastidiosa 9a5c]ALQ94319.1 ribonuclease D [Xylella fastidiosa]ALQ97827.1 ribonuclease D [Xylella fastidiosa]ALR02706.1 ribonuclease D [Xylella fastidiosa]ETE29823.1 ribonuclease D [Xylella fastidiosa 32]